MNLTLRPYQVRDIEKIRASYRKGFKAPLLQGATGSGKTVMFAYITDCAQQIGNHVMILEHRQELIGQTSRALFEMKVPHGIIAPKYSISHDKVQIASVQTLVRRLNKYPEPDLIIIDEAHHTAAGSWKKILHTYPKAKLLGVTATPIRLDGKGLGIKTGGFFDILINGSSVTELINLGYLSQPVIYAPPKQIDMSMLHKRFGDFKQDEVEDMMDKPTITGCAVEHYQKLCMNQPAIVFCASVKHAKHVSEQFNMAGVTSESIDGQLSDLDRRYRIEALGNGSIKVLTSCDIISEGTDIPIVSVGILLRPTASIGLFLQQCGRILRPHATKKFSTILDHVGNTMRHGFPDDEREWSLEGKKKRAKTIDEDPEINVVQCQNCYLMFRRSERICPHCGWEAPVMSREVEQVDGKLRKISKEEMRQIRFDRRNVVYKARTEKELNELAKEKGYSKGWVYYIMKARKEKEEKNATMAIETY